MEEKTAVKFFELLDKIVNEQDGQTWKERKEELLSYANESDKINVDEFIAWFPENE